MLSLLIRRDGIPEVNNISSILATTGTLTAVSLIVVLLRLYVRIFMLKSFGWDDGIMTVTMVRTRLTGLYHCSNSLSGDLAECFCLMGGRN